MTKKSEIRKSKSETNSNEPGGKSQNFLHLVDTSDDGKLNTERDWLINEAHELTSIFGSICRKSE